MHSKANRRDSYRSSPFQVRDMHFSDITIRESNRGIGVWQCNGNGSLGDILFENISIQTQARHSNALVFMCCTYIHTLTVSLCLFSLGLLLTTITPFMLVRLIRTYVSLNTTFHQRVPMPEFWGSGEPIVITSIPSPCTPAPGVPVYPLRGIHDVRLSNIVATSEGGALFACRGQPEVRLSVMESLCDFLRAHSDVTRTDAIF